MKERISRAKMTCILRDETLSTDLHLIHPSMQRHFMVIVTHVLTMDIELKIVGQYHGIPHVLTMDTELKI